MPKPLTLSFPQVYASVANDLMTRIGDAMAAQAGPPIGEEIEPATDQDRAEAWWARRPEATDEAMEALAHQKFAEHLQAGMDPEKAQKATAEDLTHFRYGQRMALYTYGQVGYKAQVAEAKRLAKVAARETTPNPQPPAPTMPSAQLTNLQTTVRGITAPAAPAPSPPYPETRNPEPDTGTGGAP